MDYDYDLAVIGLGPAGMAVSIMGSAMGLKVAAIEKHKIGGECMNVGCIPSKSLLHLAQVRHEQQRLAALGLTSAPPPELSGHFAKVREYVKYIGENKTLGMFKKVDLKLGQGAAEFVDDHTLAYGGQRLTARRIFIAVGTRPMVPNIPGLAESGYLTNDNIFDLETAPTSLAVLGGGAIGCELAQAFSRLGSRVTLIEMADQLVMRADPEASAVLKQAFTDEGIEVMTGRQVVRVERRDGQLVLTTDKGESVAAEKLLVAAGRSIDLASLKLGNAGVEVTERGVIKVDGCLRAGRPHIYAVGDVNGHYLLSHAAMHQGMLALMNSMSPWPFKRDFRNYVVPWTIFTDPAVSHVGLREADLRERGLKYEVIRVNYGDYGAAVAEDAPGGFLKVFASPAGKLYGISIVGKNSGELINEWALALQNRLRLHQVMLQQHSFPTMGFLSKRVGETWMMGKMQSEFLRGICRFVFRKLGF